MQASPPSCNDAASVDVHDGDHKIRCHHQDDEIRDQKNEHQSGKYQNSSYNCRVKTRCSDKWGKQKICESQTDAKEKSRKEKQEGEVAGAGSGTLMKVSSYVNILCTQCLDKDELENSVQ
jgi:hypothetical protein